MGGWGYLAVVGECFDDDGCGAGANAFVLDLLEWVGGWVDG